MNPNVNREATPEAPVMEYIRELQKGTPKNGRPTSAAIQTILNALNRSEYDPPEGFEKWDLHAYIQVTNRGIPWGREEATAHRDPAAAAAVRAGFAAAAAHAHRIEDKVAASKAIADLAAEDLAEES